jgi:phosphohistidine phosphatase
LLFCEALGFDMNTIVFKDDLYTFNEVALEKQIKNCDNRINKLILFGHNEAITNFVNKFGDEYVFNVPTAGLVVLQFEEKEWAAIKSGKIIKTIFPKEI